MKRFDDGKARSMFVGLIPAIVLGSIGLASGATITVGPQVDAYDFSSIQAGIDAAVEGDQVLAAPGEYVIADPITFRGKTITVKSEAGRDETTIRMGTPADPDRGSVVVFENNETEASVLDGFTVTGGTGSRVFIPSKGPWPGGYDRVGGGILFNASSGTVRNCEIADNGAGFGGGIICTQPCSPTLSNCKIARNTAQLWGGGVFNTDAATTMLIDCVIAENASQEDGGGVCAVDGSITLIHCIIRGNSTMGAEVVGGGVCSALASSVTLNHSIITENTSEGGGGIGGYYGSLTVTDCTIMSNTAQFGGGGGIGCTFGSLAVTDCVIMSNMSQRAGGGIYCARGSATLTNCVIARNTEELWGGGGVMCSYPDASLDITNCTIWGNSGGDPYGGGGVLCRNASATVTNSIIWDNASQKGSEISVSVAASTLTITYSNAGGGQAGVNVESGCTLDWGEGNIDADPLFARLGYWDDKGTRDTSDDVWVADDFHLKSQAGRWDHDSQTWVQDDVASPCIDAGDPMSPIGWEPFPNGGFVNMGAYGGTAEASKTYFGETICETIFAGDINGDGQVNRADLEIMVLHWTDDEPLPLP